MSATQEIFHFCLGICIFLYTLVRSDVVSSLLNPTFLSSSWSPDIATTAAAILFSVDWLFHIHFPFPSNSSLACVVVNRLNAYSCLEFLDFLSRLSTFLTPHVTYTSVDNFFSEKNIPNYAKPRNIKTHIALMIELVVWEMPSLEKLIQMTSFSSFPTSQPYLNVIYANT